MLHGPRVTLRAVQPEDFPQLARYKNDVEFEIIAGGRPPKPMTTADFAEFWKQVTIDGAVNFAIEANGKLIGDCGLFNRNRTNLSAELGIGIGHHGYWGQGYGREAITLLLDYGFRLENMRRIWLEVVDGNERAKRCYLGCGFVEEGRLRQEQWSNGEYRDVVRMGILREEWTPEPDL
jgi:RimJ/RimL family protein N-acetyltransferase